jgi:hypothetical protein
MAAWPHGTHDEAQHEKRNPHNYRRYRQFRLSLAGRLAADYFCCAAQLTSMNVYCVPSKLAVLMTLAQRTVSDFT